MHTPRLIVLLGGGIFLIICASLVRSIVLSRQAHKALEVQQQHVEALEEQIGQLEAEVQQATSSFELERRVREELQQQKPGEQVIKIQSQ